MIKGCQKKMLVLRKVDGKYFTEAFFVLREDGAVEGTDADMISEANRIVEESLRGLGDRHSRKPLGLSSRARILHFICGAASACLVMLPLFFFLR